MSYGDIAKLIMAFAISLMLTSCSYTYETYSFMKEGKIYFDIKNSDDNFWNSPNCIQRIRVERIDAMLKKIAHTGQTEPEYSTNIFWEYGDYGAPCILSFPLQYGAGQDQKYIKMTARPIQNDVVYRVSILSSGSGHADHAFIIKNDSEIINIDE